MAQRKTRRRRDPRVGPKLAPEREPMEGRLAAIEATAGCLTGVYPAGYLDSLRNEWR
jgi:hypothetical protein